MFIEEILFDISGTLTWSYFTSLTLLSPILDLTTQLNQVTNKRKPGIREGKNKKGLLQKSMS